MEFDKDVFINNNEKTQSCLVLQFFEDVYNGMLFLKENFKTNIFALVEELKVNM